MKYLLKTQEDDDMFKQHKCSQFMEFNSGHFEHRQEKLIYDHVPSPVEGFDGRQQEMYEIIEQLYDHRVVSILGPPGIGKTSIVKNLANYLNDRKVFKDGTIYVKVQKCESAEMFMSHLHITIKALHKAALDSSRHSNGEQPHSDVDSDDDVNFEDAILSKLKNKQVLLVLDNVEDVLENEHAKFVAQIETILEYCTKMKLLLTTRKPLKMKGNIYERRYYLEPMIKESTLKLLLAKSPRRIDPEEIRELLDYNCIYENRFRRAASNAIGQRGAKDSNTLLEHPLISMLGGHPQAICLSAAMLSEYKLKDLYEEFCKRNIMDVIDDCSNEKNTQNSLRVSLELSIERVKRLSNGKAMDLFALVSFLPGGVNREELNELWHDEQPWEKLKDELISSSLLLYKKEDDET